MQKKIAVVPLKFSNLKPIPKSEGLTNNYYLKKGNLWPGMARI